METYTEMKARHSDEFGRFEGVFWAFSNEQLAEGMEKVGLAKDDFKAIVSIGAGGYLRKDRVEAFRELFARQKKEMQDLKKDQATLVDALDYELSNHEFCISGDPRDAVEALGYTMETVPADALKKAIKRQRAVIVA
jgi:hypothetical protein